MILFGLFVFPKDDLKNICMLSAALLSHHKPDPQGFDDLWSVLVNLCSCAAMWYPSQRLELPVTGNVCQKMALYASL